MKKTNQKKKKNIPIKLKEEVWLKHFGKIYEHKCFIDWCTNTINTFNFEAGHDIPKSKGGTIDIFNFKSTPILSNIRDRSQKNLV